MSYSVRLEPEALESFLSLDKSIRDRIEKKLKQLENKEVASRHLQHGVPVFVEEIGQYRIVFKTREDLKEKRVYFIGDHKAYQKWIHSASL